MKHLINKGLLLVSAFVMIYAHNTATDTRIIIALLLSLIAGAVYPASLYVRVHSQLRHVQIQTTAVTSHTCPVIHIHVRQLSSDVSSPADMPHRILICYERVLLPDKSAEG